jgi:hypothetical protein
LTGIDPPEVDVTCLDEWAPFPAAAKAKRLQLQNDRAGEVIVEQCDVNVGRTDFSR